MFFRDQPEILVIELVCCCSTYLRPEYCLLSLQGNFLYWEPCRRLPGTHQPDKVFKRLVRSGASYAGPYPFSKLQNDGISGAARSPLEPILQEPEVARHTLPVLPRERIYLLNEPFPRPRRTIKTWITEIYCPDLAGRQGGMRYQMHFYTHRSDTVMHQLVYVRFGQPLHLAHETSIAPRGLQLAWASTASLRTRRRPRPYFHREQADAKTHKQLQTVADGTIGTLRLEAIGPAKLSRPSITRH